MAFINYIEKTRGGSPRGRDSASSDTHPTVPYSFWGSIRKSERIGMMSRGKRNKRAKKRSGVAGSRNASEGRDPAAGGAGGAARADKVRRFWENEPHHMVCVGRGQDGRPYAYLYINALGEKVLPVFSSIGRAREYIADEVDTPERYMDLIECFSAEAGPPPELVAGNYFLIEANFQTASFCAMYMSAELVEIDPGPGSAIALRRKIGTGQPGTA